MRRPTNRYNILIGFGALYFFTKAISMLLNVGTPKNEAYDKASVSKLQIDISIIQNRLNL